MTTRILAAMVLTLGLMLAPTAQSAELPTQAQLAELIKQSQDWYLSKQQPDGSFLEFDQFKLGATILSVDAITFGETGLPFDHPAVVAGLNYIDQFIQEDGSIQQGGYANYTTCLALMLWARSGTKDQATIEKAQKFLLGLQQMDETDINYGGIGYGSSGPRHEDLNNTTYAIAALRETGLSADHEAMKRALEFVQRCQNLTEVNDMGWAGTDGGAVYAPHQSKAGGSWSEEEQAKAAVQEAVETNSLRSYGSMTYNLITSYIYLDVNPEDPRIQAALKWCADNYQFDVNPGMPEGQEGQGLFYYYQMMAKTFGELGITEVPDTDGKDWRVGIYETAKASAIAAESGGVFWLNSADRWAEGVPTIVSSYVLTSLSRAHDSL